MGKHKFTKQTLLNAYFSMGTAKGLPEAFSANCLHGWVHPTTLPLLIKKKSVTKSDLIALEKAFVKNKTLKASNSLPYCSFTNDTAFYNKSKILSVAKSMGWKLDPTKGSRLNFFFSQIPLELDDGFSVSLGSSRLPKLKKKEHEFLISSFDAKPAYLKKRDLAIRKGHNPQVVIIENRKGIPVAAGTVFTQGKVSYLLGGGVNSRYRKRGLWTALIALRQQISKQFGAGAWVYTTENKILANKADHSSKLIVLSKSCS